jgi:hypothetical protein
LASIKGTSSDQVSVEVHFPPGLASNSSSANHATSLVMEEEIAIEMSDTIKEQVHIEEQRTRLVLLEPTQKLVSDDDGTHYVLYIPSCPQVSLASRFKTRKQQYTIKKTPLSQSGVKISSAATGDRSTIIGVLLSIVLIAIVGALSRFQSGSSTPAQRGWTMAWLASSIVGGSLISWTHKPAEKAVIKEHLQGNALIVYVVVVGAPSIGGLIVFGQMIREYGTCIQIPWLTVYELIYLELVDCKMAFLQTSPTLGWPSCTLVTALI